MSTLFLQWAGCELILGVGLGMLAGAWLDSYERRKQRSCWEEMAHHEPEVFAAYEAVELGELSITPVTPGAAVEPEYSWDDIPF